jgi:hypothetical protein
MKSNYLIVLFKNKKKRKIIKHYVNKSSALKKFNDMVLINSEILFDKLIENATPCDYEIALLTNQTKVQQSLFLTDNLGRNNPVNLENPDYVFLDKKIKFLDLIKEYCSDKNFKSIFTLNNKLCIQIDEDVSLFSLKDKDESERLLEVMQDYFISNSRSDAFFVKDVSNAQRKWLYDIMEKKGFDKRRLYRLKTTFSKR